MRLIKFTAAVIIVCTTSFAFSQHDVVSTCQGSLSLDIVTVNPCGILGTDCATVNSDRVGISVPEINSSAQWDWVEIDFGDGSDVLFLYSVDNATIGTVHEYPISGTYTVSVEVNLICPDLITTESYPLESTFHTADAEDGLNFTMVNTGELQYTFTYYGGNYSEISELGWVSDIELDFGDDSFVTLSIEDLIPGTVLAIHTYSSDVEGESLDVELSFEQVSNGCTCSISELKSRYIPPCDCHSFQPEAGDKYWLSAWVLEEHNEQVKSYNEANLQLNFLTDVESIVTNFHPTGEIIDGWQRIVGEFIMPDDVNEMEVLLNAHPTQDTYFDDIRIHPYNGSMKSYVYDGETFWLTSELDDNNYATFYEYDQEGGLVRIKKETSRGIVTIQETRSSTLKVDDNEESE